MKHFLLSFFLLFSTLLGAQHYYPMLDSANSWSYTGNAIPAIVQPPHHSPVLCNYMSGAGMNTMQEYTTSDSVIGSITYKMLYQNQGPTISNPCYLGLIREDTALHKVYFKDNQGDPEQVLYDFSKQVGDTMKVIARTGNYFQSGTYRVDSIRMLHIKAGMRRLFYLNCQTCGINPPTLEWLESTGNRGDALYAYTGNFNIGGGIFNYCNGVNKYPHAMAEIMTCFEHRYINYYDSCAFNEALHNSCIYYQDTCNYWNICGGIKEYQSLNKWTVFPNPASSHLMLQLDVAHADRFEIRILDLNGRQVMNTVVLGLLGEGIQEKEMDIASLPDGLYLMECRTGQELRYRKLSVQH
ncbi:MAG TPA: T9SS type A sorting domain-containing protein [Bacteroidia bacterium]|nr:T9SS type A sorting domain-containing protein [Bacteroidia bacterium]